MNAGEKYEFLFKSNLLEIQCLLHMVKWVICGKSACLQDGDNNAMKEVDKTSVQESLEQKLGTEGFQKWVSCILSKICMLYNKCFWLVGSYRE
jgi:hypothetical protein